MADADASETDALTRLEAALDRIARTARPAPALAAHEPDTAAVAARIDALIDQLRGALASDASALASEA